jgi:imidazolonepropionase-like amidohydrolase
VSTTALKGGTLIDGKGSPPSLGAVLISGPMIERVGDFEAPADARAIDCHGPL